MKLSSSIFLVTVLLFTFQNCGTETQAGNKSASSLLSESSEGSLDGYDMYNGVEIDYPQSTSQNDVVYGSNVQLETAIPQFLKSSQDIVLYDFVAAKEEITVDLVDPASDGSSASEHVWLSESSDVFSAGEGMDLVYGFQGNDEIYGNEGRDYIHGGRGSDSLFGGQDDDLIYGGIGNDKIQGNRGGDVLLGNQGHDLIEGGEGNDKFIHGGQGNDEIYGNEGNDRMYGGIGNDIMHGGQDDDVLYGNEGNDHLHGGEGKHNYLDGGTGYDMYYVSGESLTIVDPEQAVVCCQNQFIRKLSHNTYMVGKTRVLIKSPSHQLMNCQEPNW